MQRVVLVWFVLLLVGCAQASPTAVYSNNPITAVPDLIWQFAAGDKLEAPAQVVGEHVVVATKTAVIALNASNGQEAWRVAPPHGVWPRSLASSSNTIFVGIPGGLLALDASSGRERWQQATTGEVLWPPLPGSTLYVATAFVGPGIEPRPDQHAWGYALDPASGKILWSLETDTYTLITPTASGTRVVFGGSRLDESDVNEGGHLRLHLLTSDGTLLWAVDTIDGFLKSVALDEQ
ncbi:MAG: PQQ-binding-like beta-propeller repeat protein, partial [Anaerolineales bacterium]|nr:PQQ-binding-like beta-propeller repeat protein [Anaerolineales bacterium]